MGAGASASEKVIGVEADGTKVDIEQTAEKDSTWHVKVNNWRGKAVTDKNGLTRVLPISTLIAGKSRDQLVSLASLAEQGERYEDMVQFMESVATGKDVLNITERNLLSVAYKNVIGVRRASWRVYNAIYDKQKSEDDKAGIQSDMFTLAMESKEVVEQELIAMCHNVLRIIAQLLLHPDTDTESMVFYHKMSGDYYRYIAEVTCTDEIVQSALENYNKANSIARELQTTHPIRLGLALNYSVFYYEICSKHQEACSIAKQAFDDAIAELDRLPEDSYKDATLIMQLLRDNLTLWTTEAEEGSGEKED